MAAIIAGIAGLSGYSLFRSVGWAIAFGLVSVIAYDLFLRWRNDEDARYPFVNPHAGLEVESIPVWIAALLAGIIFALIGFDIAW